MKSGRSDPSADDRAHGSATSDVSRRVWFRRIGLGAGALVAGATAVAVTEGDRGADAERALFTEALGSGGPLVVFLPGLGATTRYWRSRVVALSSRARLMLVDLLGFGHSPKPWLTYSVDAHVSALHRVLEPIGAKEPLVIVGHSVGARLAVAYAARHPEHVQQLVLVSVPYFGNGESARQFTGKRGAAGWIMTHMVPAALACLVTRRLLGWALPTLLPNVPREVAEDLTRMTWRSSTSTLWQVIYEYDLSADLRQIEGRIPLLCLHGDRDQSAPLAPLLALAQQHRQCTVVVYPGADHSLPLQHPDWIRAHISSVLAGDVIP